MNIGILKYVDFNFIWYNNEVGFEILYCCYKDFLLLI